MPNAIKTLLVACISICVTVVAMLLIWNSMSNKPLLPDKPPDSVDENAVIDTFDNDKLITPDGGSGLSLEYAKEVSIDLTSKTATLYFKNCGESLQDAVIVLVVQDTAILQSDLLPPNSVLTAMPLPDDGVPLQCGEYDGVLLVQFFNEDGEAARLNSRIEGITVSVTE